MSDAELPQVMVGVEVTPAEPFRGTQGSEEWVRSILELRDPEALDHVQEALAILFEVAGRGPSGTLLDFGSGGNPLRPRKGYL